MDGERISVLLVEDNPGDTRLIQEMFAEVKDVSFELECTDRLSSALEHLAQGSTDVVLLDLSLPDSQGLDTYIRAHRQAPDIPIVVLTGHDDAALAVRAVREGAQDYLVKWQVDSGLLTRFMRYAVERHKLLEELEQARQQREQGRLRSIINGNVDAMVIVDMDGIVRFVNLAAESLFGRSSEDFVGKPFGFPIIAGETQELDIARANDEVAIAEMRAVEMEWEGKNAYLASLRDMTARKQAEEARLLMEQQLQRAGRLAAVGELAAGIAHELNNPLTAIQMYSQILRSRTDLDRNIWDDIDTIFKEAQRATKITGNLLSFARTYTPEKRPISINEVIVSILELHAYRMRVNNIEIAIELDPDLPETMADFHQMQQVFVNLVANAEQVMTEAHQGGKLTIKSQKVGEVIWVTFADNGPGISDENMGRIFDPFFTTKDVGKGTGLGLSICHSIIEDHGGHITVESKPGEGAAFLVEIPVVTEDQAVSKQVESDTAED